MNQPSNAFTDAESLALKSIVGTAGVSQSAALALFDETGLAPDDFSRPECRAVCAATLAILRDGREPDALGILNLVKDPALREFVVDVVVNSQLTNAKDRAASVRTEGQRRKVLDALRAVAAGLKNRDVPLNSSISEAQKVLQAFTASAGARTMDSGLFSFLDALDQVQRGGKEPVLATGIDALDFLTGGLQRTLTILGALPGVGKSALIAAIVRNLISRNVRVGLLSLEDEGEWVARRLLSEAASVPLFVLGKKPLGPHQMQRVGEASSALHGHLKNLICDDTSGMTVPDVLASARRMIAMGARAILVDHLGEIRLERSERHDLDIAHALQELRGLAKTYGVPVVVACHLRRREGLTPMDAPRLTDFAFSAAVERMARVALGLYRVKGNGGPDAMGVALLKQTEGPSGLEFRLEVNTHAGTVAQTQVTSAMREEMKWRNE